MFHGKIKEVLNFKFSVISEFLCREIRHSGFQKFSKIILSVLISVFIFSTFSYADTNADTDALKTAENALIYKFHSAQTKSKKAKAAKNLFRYYVNANNYERIIFLSNELLEYKLSKKDKYFVYYNLAKAYKYYKKTEDAANAAQEAEYLYPKKIDVKMLLGGIYKENGLYELAINKFKAVLDRDGSHVTALVNLGDIYKDMENYKTALNYYLRAVDIRKTLPVDVYINTAVSCKEIGSLEKAVEILENIKEENKTVNLLLADIYLNGKEFKKAQEKLKPFVYKEDTDIEIYCKLANLYILLENYEEARNILVYFKDKNKNMEAVDLLLSETYYRQGNVYKALKIIKNILSYTKSDYIKKEIEKILIFENKTEKQLKSLKSEKVKGRERQKSRCSDGRKVGNDKH